MKDILITYFVPFGNRTTNASKEVALSLNLSCDILELPVEWNKAKEIIDTLEEYRYIFMFGEAGSYKELTIEKCAHNISNECPLFR